MSCYPLYEDTHLVVRAFTVYTGLVALLPFPGKMNRTLLTFSRCFLTDPSQATHSTLPTTTCSLAYTFPGLRILT